MHIIKIDNVKIGFRPYLLLNYYMLYSQAIIATLTLLGVVMFYGLVKWLFGLEDMYNDIPYFQLLAIALILGVLPMWVYKKSQEHYAGCKPLNELLSYTLTDDMIRVEGETFSDSARWDELYDVKEVVNWFVFFLNKDEVIYLPKEHIGKQEVKWLKKQIKELRLSHVNMAA